MALSELSGSGRTGEVHLTGDPMKILLASQCFSGQLLYEFHLNILNFQEPLPLARQKIINFLMEPVNFEFRMDAYLVITFGMETVSHLLPVLAHNNDGSLNCGKGRKDKIEQDIGIRVEWPR